MPYLQPQQDQQGDVVHAPLHPLVQGHGAAGVGVDGHHHVLQHLGDTRVLPSTLDQHSGTHARTRTHTYTHRVCVCVCGCVSALNRFPDSVIVISLTVVPKMLSLENE